MNRKTSLFLLSCIVFMLSSSLFCQAMPTSDPTVLDLYPYHRKTVTKNGRQFHESAWEEHDGRHILMLVANKDQLMPEKEIRSGTPVFVSFDSDDMGMLFVNDTHDLENGELVICIDTDDASLTDPQKSYNISLDFYAEDLSEITYTSRIKSVPSSDVAIIPQTGDNAVGFVFIAVTSLILMTFILAPKRSRFFSLSK